MTVRKRHSALIGAGKPAHREFDGAIGQFAPAFDRTHIGRLGIAIEEVARPRPGLVARQRESLAQIAVVRLAPAGHPAREIARTKDHVVTPDTGRQVEYRAGGERILLAALARSYWLLLPVLLFLGAAAALGASVLRTVPQGSEEALASGIFLKDSL